MKKIGVYIHIPFCKQKCDYCDFISYSNKNNLIDKYIKKLKQEIMEEVTLKKLEISTIYIGGGTPSYIDSEHIKSIIQEFDNINKVKEITIEVNPGTVTEEKLEIYIKCGINRISIGMQSCNNRILNNIGRIHTYEEFLQTYNMAREVGFKNINVDVMIGLPNQSLEDLQDTIHKVIKLNPEHISVYSLIVEDKTKLKDKIDNNKLKLPNENKERQMYWNAKVILQNYGYIHYEISNFAKKGYKSKHNLDCWEQKEYIGIGIAAHSYINNTRYSNTEDIEEYIEKNLQEVKQVNEKQNDDLKMKEYMLLGLRKINGIKTSDFKNKFIHNPVYIYREVLSKLVGEQLLEIDNDYIKLTNRGIDLANLVWQEFI